MKNVYQLQNWVWLLDEALYSCDVFTIHNVEDNNDWSDEIIATLHWQQLSTA